MTPDELRRAALETPIGRSFAQDIGGRPIGRHPDSERSYLRAAEVFAEVVQSFEDRGVTLDQISPLAVAAIGEALDHKILIEGPGPAVEPEAEVEWFRERYHDVLDATIEGPSSDTPFPFEDGPEKR